MIYSKPISIFYLWKIIQSTCYLSGHKKIIPQRVGTIQLLCISNSGPKILFLHNVLYILGAIANFISQGQMQHKKYSLSIIQEGIKVTYTIILAYFIANNFYKIETFDLNTISADLSSVFLVAFLVINKKTVRIWNKQLGYLGIRTIY